MALLTSRGPFAFALGTLFAGGAAALPPVVLDGRFDEWAARPTVLLDPADAGRGEIDLGLIKVAEEPDAVTFFVELGRTVNLQRLDGHLVLVVDGDGDPGTGADMHGLDGADLVVTFTPANPRDPARPGAGVSLRRLADGAWQEIGPYAQPVAFAPTSASRNAEIRLGRGPDMLAGERFRFRLVAFDRSGSVIDETDSVSVALAQQPARVDALELATDPFLRAAETDVRVVCWNVERGGLASRPEPFGRVLRALRPDLLLLCELTDKESADSLRTWLDREVPVEGGSWNVIFGAGGGNLRTAVASTLPMTPVAALDRVEWRDGAGAPRDVRFAGGLVRAGSRELLACAVHLKCCGGLGTEEDLTRLEETQSIRTALRLAAMAAAAGGTELRADAIVIGGDYNLVGSIEPLELMVEGIDADGTNLAVADVLQLDARTSATWSDPGQPFTPGRLDYVLFGDAALVQRGGFVLDARDLAPRWLEAHGLAGDETEKASDHLPVVIDLAWRPAKRESRE